MTAAGSLHAEGSQMSRQYKAWGNARPYISSGLQLLPSHFPLPLNLVCKVLVLCQLLLKGSPGDVASFGRS